MLLLHEPLGGDCRDAGLPPGAVAQWHLPIDWVMTAFIVLTVTTFINGLLFKAFQAAVRTHVMKHEAQQMLNSHEQ